MPDLDAETPKKKGTEKSKKNQQSKKKPARQGINKSPSINQVTAEEIFQTLGYITPDLHHEIGRSRRRVQKKSTSKNNKKTPSNSSDDENDNENKPIRKSPRLNKFRTILHE